MAGWLTSVASRASAGPVEADGLEVEAEDLAGPVEQRAGGRELVVELAAHADGLGPLAGEQEGDLGHRLGVFDERRTKRSRR